MLARHKRVRLAVKSATLLLGLGGLWLVIAAVRGNSQTTPAQVSRPTRQPNAAHPAPAVPAGALAQAMEQLRALPIAPLPHPWTSIGPAPVGGVRGLGPNGNCAPNPLISASGRATAIGFGLSPSTVYLGTASGGVWKSTSGGNSWKVLTDIEPSLAVGALTVIPGKNAGADVIYAGTGESNQSGDNLPGNGILKSTDGGRSWQQQAANTFAMQTFGRLAVIPGQAGKPDILYAATTRGVLGSATSVTASPPVIGGIFKSTDGGIAWAMRSGKGGLPAGGQFEGSAADVVVDPTTPANVYAAIECIQDCSNGGVYKSTDAGKTWQQLNNGIPDQSARMTLVISPDGQTLYSANTADGDNFDAIYRSTDAGDSWAARGKLPLVGGNAQCLGIDQADYNLALGADPEKPKTIYLGLIGLYKSLDGGAHWSYTLSKGHPDFHVVTVNSGSVWALNDGGVTVSTDGGKTWNDSINKGLATLQFQGIGIASGANPLVAGGTQDNGIISFTGNPVWTDAGINADGGLAAIATNNPAVVFSETQEAGLRRSLSAGATDSFVDITPPLIPDEVTQFYAPFSLDPGNSDRLLYGTNRIWESCAVSPTLTCDATSGIPQPNWTAISPALNPGCSVRSEDGVSQKCLLTDVRVAPGKPAVLYAVTNVNGNIGPFAWVSTNSNTAVPTFANVSAGLPKQRGLTSVSISPASPGTVIVSVQGFTGGGRHIFQSGNFGQNWNDITTAASGYPDLPTLKVLYDPLDFTGSTIYAGTTMGVLRSTDNGNSWANFNGDSLPNVQVFDLQRSSRRIAAATHGRGVWVMQAPVFPVVNSISSPLRVGGSFTINGTGFTAGSVVNFFISTSTGPINAGPFKPSARSLPAQLTVHVPLTTTLGQGFVTVQVVNTDQDFATSNAVGALLLGSAAAGIPSLTTINGMGLAPTSTDPAYGVNNVRTVIMQGSLVTLGGTGFDTTNGVAVDVFCACTGGKLPTTFIKPGGGGLTPTIIMFTMPADAPTGPGSIVVSNRGGDGSYSKKSNAVSVPIGASITVTSVVQVGGIIAVKGTGFSVLTVINLFNLQGGITVNLGGIKRDGTPRIPLAVTSSTRFTFTRPKNGVPGPAYVQANNPPFVPFTSSGNSPKGVFTLK